MGGYSIIMMCQFLNLLSSILAILLTCPNSDTLLCYSNDPFSTMYKNVLKPRIALIFDQAPFTAQLSL